MQKKAIILSLSKILKAGGKEEKRIHEDKYFKGVIKHYGLTLPEARAIFKGYYEEHLKEYSDEEMRDLGYAFLEESYADQKLMGIECLKTTINTYSPEDLHTIEPYIDKNVFDWSTCDTLCSQVLSKVLQKHEECIEVIQSWKDAPSSWRQRAACVSFLYFSRHDQHTNMIMDICESVVHNPYRFTQLGAGWVMRDVSVYHPKLIIDFLNDHEELMIQEAVRYATEKMSPQQKKKVNALTKRLRSKKQEEN